MNESFKEWLKSQQSRQDRIGEFARKYGDLQSKSLMDDIEIGLNYFADFTNYISALIEFQQDKHFLCLE